MKWLKYILITGIFLILITGGIMMFSKMSSMELIKEKGEGFVMASEEESGDIVVSRTLTSTTYQTSEGSFYVTSGGFMNYWNGSEFKEINTTITSYNQDGYNYAMLQAPYKLYFKSNSAWGDGVKFCVEDGENYCLIYQSSDMSFRNQYGSQDYISSIQNSQATINNSEFTYPNVYPNVNLTMIAYNGLLKELYVLKEKPRNPAGRLGSNVTLDFGGYIKFPNLNMYVNGILMTEDFKTSEEIEFRTSENVSLFHIPKPTAHDSNGSRIDLEYEVDVRTNEIWFYVKTPYSWLNDSSRVYPVYIDPSAGPNSPGTMANSNVIGTVAWSNPDNAKTSNDVDASIALKSQISNYLKATNFGFSIPVDATINGIKVEVECATTDIFNKDKDVRIVKSDGSLGSENKYKDASLPASDTIIEYGGEADLWSETWSYTDINDADFGFVFAIAQTYPFSTTTAYVDHIKITVYYTEGAPPSSCASLVGNEWYVPKGCQCYCDKLADGQLNLSKCSCVSV